MERVNIIPPDTTLKDLPSVTEAAISELDSLRRQVKFQLGAIESPSGGDTFYSEESNSLYIYNSIEKEWMEQ